MGFQFWEKKWTQAPIPNPEPGSNWQLSTKKEWVFFLPQSITDTQTTLVCRPMSRCKFFKAYKSFAYTLWFVIFMLFCFCVGECVSLCLYFLCFFLGSFCLFFLWLFWSLDFCLFYNKERKMAMDFCMWWCWEDLGRDGEGKPWSEYIINQSICNKNNINFKICKFYIMINMRSWGWTIKETYDLTGCVSSWQGMICAVKLYVTFVTGENHL